MRESGRSGISTALGFGLGAFSRDELDSIHYATLQVLQDTGVKVLNNEALEIFREAGASVERFEGYGIVKIPSHVVEECIFRAPRVTVYNARDPRHDHVGEPNRVGFTTFGGCVNVIDPFTREHRGGTKKDSGGIALLCDSLDEISVVVRSVIPVDTSLAEAQSVHNLEALLNNTGKHIIIGADSLEALRVMTRMAEVCVGGKENFRKQPIFSVFVCPVSPLTITDHVCKITMEAAALGLGIVILPMALSGATSPAATAGTLVTHNSEVLSSLVLAQLTARGTPCTYGCCSTILDLRFGTPAIGAPEYGMIGASSAKLAQYYRLPSFAGGGASDSKVPDIQGGYEFALSATLSALAGGNIVFGSGVLEQGLTFDYAKLVMDAEMIRMILTAVKGVAVTDETLSMDVIHEVGPGGGFIAHDHTLLNAKTQSRSELFDRRSREEWMELTGGSTLTERAYEKAQQILQNHKPLPLPKGAPEAMKKLVAEFEAEIRMGKK